MDEFSAAEFSEEGAMNALLELAEAAIEWNQTPQPFGAANRLHEAVKKWQVLGGGDNDMPDRLWAAVTGDR